MAKTASERNKVLVIGSASGLPVYLGELDKGLRQGVSKLENATRFTARGAARVAKSYPGSEIMDAIDTTEYSAEFASSSDAWAFMLEMEKRGWAPGYPSTIAPYRVRFYKMTPAELALASKSPSWKR